MENTFEKKKNEELQAENTYLAKEVQSLRETTAQNRKSFDELREIVNQLQADLETRAQYEKEQAGQVRRLEKTCN